MLWAHTTVNTAVTCVSQLFGTILGKAAQLLPMMGSETHPALGDTVVTVQAEFG